MADIAALAERAVLMAGISKQLVIIAAAFFFISACDAGGSHLSVGSQHWDCEDLNCEASFVVDNLNESEADLTFSIRLFKSIDESGNQIPETVVGEASGRLKLQSQEKRTVVAQISVAEEPNRMSVGVATAN